jgi:aspartate kinase
MSFMIEEDDVEEAIRSLHSVFFADPDPSIFDLEARRDLEARAVAQTAGGKR